MPPGEGSNPAVLSYYDGNTVTALWNYAQHFAMSDNMYGTNFGPSTPGAFNVVAGQTYGVTCGPVSATINDTPCGNPAGLNATDPASSDITTSASGPTSVADQPAAGGGTGFGDADPTFDICTYLPSPDGGDRADLLAVTPERGRQHRHRLHPAPRAVPVLGFDGQPDAPAADLGQHGRAI